MYYYLDIESYGQLQRHIFFSLPDGAVRSFPLVPDNPNTALYEEWLSRGGIPEQWPPNGEGV